MARAELARNDLIAFCQYIDPGAADRYRAKHLARIAEELEKVERGEIDRLFITTPPRHWKSSLVSEKFTTWYLARHPQHSIGVFSHGAALPTRFSVSVRKNIEWNRHFTELFPNVKFAGGNTSDWSLTGAFRSSFRSMGVLSAPTGEGFDLIIIDDPIADANEANSPAALEKVQRWYKETLRDRLNPGGKIIMVMSRWAQNDLAGYVLRESETGDGEQWDSLRLPAICEQADELGRQPGDALWPEWMPLSALDRLKKAQGNRAFAARFQGSPRAEDGNMLNSSKLIMVDADEVPNLMTVVRRWDLAFSDTRSADYSAGVKMGVTHDGRYYILHVKRVHGRWTHTAPIIMQYADRDGLECIVMVEANGTQLGYADEMRQRIANRTVEADKPEGNKEMRAALWGTRLDDGIIHCVRGEWNQELFDEMDYFPNAENDDVIDGVSGAWNRLAQSSNNAGIFQTENPDRLHARRYDRRALFG